MKDSARQTRTDLMGLFEQQGVHPRADLGQNFLIDLNLIDYIVRSAELTPDDVVLEVGAGTGGMTAFLARQAAAVVSVEIDSHMYAFAQEKTAGIPNVTLINSDALKNKGTLHPRVVEEVRKQLAVSPERRLKLVSNLPYSVATPVVSNLVASDIPWRAMVITIQWELAKKMRANPDSPDYGALSVWLQAQSWVRVLKKLPPTVFWPRPKVDSAIVRLFPHPGAAAQIGNRAFFQDFIRRLFSQRRKYMRSVLVGMYRKQLTKAEADAVLAPFNLPPEARAETLPVEQLVRLGRAFGDAIAAKGELPEQEAILDF